MTNFTQQIVANPEGGTVQLDGGPLPDRGYFVGGIVNALIIDDTFTPKSTMEALEVFVTYLREHTDVPYIGWWTDEQDGKLYVDGTSWYADEQEARRIGKSRGEIAIFDVERKTSIYLDPAHPVNRS